jgi:hypothetical protein
VSQGVKLNVEDPAAPILKKIASRGQIEKDEREAIALFIAITAARNPEVMKQIMDDYLDNRLSKTRARTDALVRLWCELVRRPYRQDSHAEFNKPGQFSAMWE